MNRYAVEDLTLTYRGATALAGVSLEFPAGRISAVLGPSGCGKTSLLRALAGLSVPDAGRVFLGGEMANDPRVRIPPEARGVGMVFQDSLLWPHLSVRKNIAFPLGRASAADPRVEVAARACEVEHLLDRLPAGLSGGEQRRVAVARAIVGPPRILLLDEPLTGLDASLRVRLLSAIRDIQRRLGVTTVCVTHDQEEALGLSDRVSVMNAGRVLQSGTPEEVYSRPRGPFVAAFLGVSTFLPATLDGGVAVTGVGRFPAPGLAGERTTLLVRPETVRVVPDGEITGRVVSCLYRGDRWLVRYSVAEQELLGYSDRHMNEGADVRLAISPHPVPVAEDETRC
ncbi:MAG: ABC transporter ATP-binding protein [Planctomycetes bacterium]|jgi:ABC-type Fe3+/spermidine/putrescine transport system ATPase subunit|nr:ABC transporter ATP-binding protein [Planctomycetota bacterium]